MYKQITSFKMRFLFPTLSLFITSVCAADLTQVTDFGENPGNDEMYIYVPDTLAESPAVVLAVHLSLDMFIPLVFLELTDRPSTIASSLRR